MQTVAEITPDSSAGWNQSDKVRVYYNEQTKMVVVDGYIRPNSALSANAEKQVATIPASYRPAFYDVANSSYVNANGTHAVTTSIVTKSTGILALECPAVSIPATTYIKVHVMYFAGQIT